jgi:hypothetical protein
MTLFNFQRFLTQLTSVSLANQKLLSGFPPKEFTLQLDEPIKKAVNNNDIVMLQVRQTSTEESAGTASNNNAEATNTNAPQPTNPPPAAAPKKRPAANNNTNNVHTLFGNKRGRGRAVKSKESIESALIEATESKNKSRSTGDVVLDYFKASMKNALQQQQKESLANKRYQASLSGDFNFETKASYRLGDNYQPNYVIKFKSGPRTWSEEVHEDFTKEELAGIITEVFKTAGDAGKELLKPFKMALASPRVFWAMVRQFGDVDKGLKELLPDVNWEFIDERKRSMSQKAIESQNLKDIVKRLVEAKKARKAEAGEGDDEDEEDSDETLLLALEEDDEEEPVVEAKDDDEFSLNKENKTKKRKRASAKRGTTRSVKRKTNQEVPESGETKNDEAEQTAELRAEQTD